MECQLYDLIPRLGICLAQEAERILCWKRPIERDLCPSIHPLFSLQVTFTQYFLATQYNSLYFKMLTLNDDDHKSLQLENAAGEGNLSKVKALVENSPSTSHKSIDESLQSALHNAIRGGHTLVASYLFAHGARFTSDMSHCALAAENPEAIFQLALDHGWDINAQTDLGPPVLTYILFGPLIESQLTELQFRHTNAVCASS